jgi:hypothetical protein
MKLLDVRDSVPAWAALKLLKKTPKLSYRLLKYEAAVAMELDVIEKQRDVYGREVSGTAFPDQWAIEGGTPQATEYHAKFNQFLDGESDLKPTGVTMDELVDALDAEAGNSISEQHLALLEPFFTQPESN